MYRRLFILIQLLFALALSAGCATTPAPQLHQRLKPDLSSSAYKKIVLLPVDISVYELSAGGVLEEVPEWSEEAEESVRAAMLASRDMTGKSRVSRSVSTDDFTEEEREIIDEHLALFSVVGGSALWTTDSGNKAWNFKSEEFDYTLGAGLSFLKTKYGFDAGLVVVGTDTVATAGRTATMITGAIFGVVVPMGHTSLVGGLVDVEKGDLLWLNQTASGAGPDLRDTESCLDFVRNLMDTYPAFGAEDGD